MGAPGNIRELQNVIEQATWFADREMIDVGHLPPAVRNAGEALLPTRERRRQVADDLYDALVSGGYSFWEHIHPIFLQRDITRHDIRELIVRGLRTTQGNYRALLRLFGIPTHDYKRFYNFLTAHGCKVDYRSFREGTPEPARRHQLVLPPLRPLKAAGPVAAPPPPRSSSGQR
jgi:DNA-binding NtrC family response regulator